MALVYRTLWLKYFFFHFCLFRFNARILRFHFGSFFFSYDHDHVQHVCAVFILLFLIILLKTIFHNFFSQFRSAVLIFEFIRKKKFAFLLIDDWQCMWHLLSSFCILLTHSTSLFRQFHIDRTQKRPILFKYTWWKLNVCISDTIEVATTKHTKNSCFSFTKCFIWNYGRHMELEKQSVSLSIHCG